MNNWVFLKFTSLSIIQWMYFFTYSTNINSARPVLAFNFPEGDEIQNMNLVLLLDAPNRFGARCLDGSPPAYYIRPGDSTRFVIYFQGGGWCYDQNDCLGRSTGSTGSSKHYPPTIGDKGGIISPDMTKNPDFAKFTAVWVPYCDGGSFSGNLANPVTVSNKKIWFRGRANMHAVVTDLIENYTLGTANEVLIDGGSAGGLTVLLHADFFRSLIPNVKVFGAIGDAGWFRPDKTMDHLKYTEKMHGMYQMINASVNEACVNANVNHSSDCIFAPVVFPHLTSDMFILEGSYDSWQLLNIMGFHCSTYHHDLHTCTAAQNASMLKYGVAMRQSIRIALNSSDHHRARAGAFVPACILHVESAFNEGNDAWSSISAYDDSQAKRFLPREVVKMWFSGLSDMSLQEAKGRLIEDCDFPCNPDCQMFT